MSGRARDVRVRFRWVIVVGAALGIGAAVACSGEIITRPAPCKGAGCSCEEDPFQPLCKGFNDRPEGGTGVVLDADTPDTGDASKPSEAGDAASDAPADG
jgi:hypothetical protein